MTKLQAIRSQFGELTTREKLELAADLLECLPPVLEDEDDGVAEAQRRGDELDADPSLAITWEQLRKSVGR